MFYLSKCLLLFLSFFLFWTQILSQNPFANFKVDHYDSKNGMPNDFVMNTYQTREGFIWMNSYAGYIRFDGKQFVTFNSSNTPALKTDNSNSLFTESEDSTLWLTVSGVGLVSYKRGVFNTYLEKTNAIFLRGKTAKGELILSPPFTGNEDTDLIVFDPKSKKHFTIKAKQYKDYRFTNLKGSCSSCNEWFISSGKISHKERDGKWKVLAESEGIKNDVFIISVFKDSKSRVWLTSSQGIYLWTGSRFNAYPGLENVNVPTPNPSFAYIVEDAVKGIWVSVGNGVAYLPEGSTQFYLFPKQYINIQTLHCLDVDRENNIWLSTDRGLFKISRTKVTNFAEAEGIVNNRVSAVTELSTGKFLITSSMDSLYWLENDRILPYKIKNRDVFKGIVNIIHSYTDKNGNVWLTHQSGVIKISPQGESKFSLPGQTRYATEGLDGKMYFGVAYQGIFTIDDYGNLKKVSFPKVDFKDIYISSIHQLKDSSWIITSYRSGAFKIDKSGNKFDLNLFNGAMGIQVFNVIEDEKGLLWFATGKGIVKWEGNKSTLIGYESGLKETSIFNILMDYKGTWWFPTNKGIFFAKAAEIKAYAKGETKKIGWNYLDDGDGMNNRQCVGARHSIVGKKGGIYIPAIGGLVVINPDRLPTNTIPPLISINQMQVDDSSYYGDVKIEPGDHRYIFDYSALSFIAPSKNLIKFKLNGRDRDWIYSKGDNRAIYTNLSPGDYSFEVTASNNDGVWATKSVVFHFSVLPFFYQTVWFKVLVVVLFFGLIWAFVLWRTRVARLKNKMLEQQVLQRTAELQTSLEKLQSAQKQLVQSEKMASLGELTAGIAHEIQNPLNFVNNFSEVSSELIEEMKAELDKGDIDEAKAIATDVQQNLSKIVHHGKRADSIVKGMLQHSRSSSGQKELTDINALCDEYLRLSYHGLRAKDKQFQANFSTQFDENIKTVSVLKQELGRVILNLINNAFYAVNEMSKNASMNYQPTVSISTKKVAEFVQIEVADNGNGIPDSIKDKIFQPFFTTKPTGEGTGLGLSLSYDIITKAHGGQLFVNSESGRGTTFTILIPAN